MTVEPVRASTAVGALDSAVALEIEVEVKVRPISASHSAVTTETRPVEEFRDLRVA